MNRRGFTLIELFATLVVIAVLLALLLPAIQQVREASRRTRCRNQLKQMGLALHNYHDKFGSFPPGAVTGRGSSPTSNCPVGGIANRDSRASWLVLLLPYVDQVSRYQQFDFNSSFFGLVHAPAPATNAPAQMEPLALVECPSDPNSRPDNALTNYFGVQGGGSVPDCTGSPGFTGRVFFHNGVFHNNSRVRFTDVVDGTSQTFAVGETVYLQLRGGGPNYYGTWASSFWTVGTGPGDQSSLAVTLAAAVLPINRVDLNPRHDWTAEHQSRTFGSRHLGGCHFLLADGAVRFFSENMDPWLYQSVSVRNDGHGASF
ncbi:MAG: DUF1559 domain-containing protein [Planctomycetaceae bacterium]|nr:DUF1559 domain-containing protein [Planctomycetaceae bacterium]